MRMGDNVERQRTQHCKDLDVRERGGQRRRVMAGIKWCGEKQAEITS